MLSRWTARKACRTDRVCPSTTRLLGAFGSPGAGRLEARLASLRKTARLANQEAAPDVGTTFLPPRTGCCHLSFGAGVSRVSRIRREQGQRGRLPQARLCVPQGPARSPGRRAARRAGAVPRTLRCGPLLLHPLTLGSGQDPPGPRGLQAISGVVKAGPTHTPWSLLASASRDSGGGCGAPPWGWGTGEGQGPPLLSFRSPGPDDSGRQRFRPLGPGRPGLFRPS